MMQLATAHLINGNRLHLQHGPIDLIIGVDADSARQQKAYLMAFSRFKSVLSELAAELPLLKSPAYPGSAVPESPVARRMMAAVRPLSRHRFITPMAAVAGSVADEILDTICSGFSEADLPSRIYVNNGGDIAIHLAGDATYTVNISREDATSLGNFTITAASQSRGIATSGRGGRSLSMGIADSVTILARNAAEADAAATLVANATDPGDHPSIRRQRACDVVDDSDLGERLVVTACGALSPTDVDMALDHGLAEAQTLATFYPVEKAALFLQSRHRFFVAGGADFRYSPVQSSLELTHHA